MNLLGKTKIDDSNVAVVVDHEILWLQISVAVATFVKIAEALDDAGDVESSNGIVEWSLVVKNAPEIATQVSIEKKINILLI